MKTKTAVISKLIAAILCVALPLAAFAADNSFKIAYDGGSLPGLKPGVDLKVSMDASRILLVKNKSEIVSIPVAAVTEISYGQDVHRRVGAAVGLAFVSFGVGALMALSKSKKHFIGLTWDDAGNKGGLSFQADKSDYRGLLSGLEGVTGKKAVNSDALTVKN
jgi:hypothetical protein